jgi:hypothetical protein
MPPLKHVGDAKDVDGGAEAGVGGGVQLAVAAELAGQVEVELAVVDVALPAAKDLVSLGLKAHQQQDAAAERRAPRQRRRLFGEVVEAFLGHTEGVEDWHADGDRAQPRLGDPGEAQIGGIGVGGLVAALLLGLLWGVEPADVEGVDPAA